MLCGRLSAPVLLAALAVGCTEAPGGAYRPIRLTDRLADAVVSGPLSDLPAAGSVRDLGPGVRRQEVWRASLPDMETRGGCRPAARALAFASWPRPAPDRPGSAMPMAGPISTTS